MPELSFQIASYQTQRFYGSLSRVAFADSAAISRRPRRERHQQCYEKGAHGVIPSVVCLARVFQNK